MDTEIRIFQEFSMNFHFIHNILMRKFACPKLIFSRTRMYKGKITPMVAMRGCEYEGRWDVAR